MGCNVFGGGRPVIFAENLTEEYGEGIVGELYRKAREIKKDFPYKEKIEHYKKLLKEFEG